MDITANARFLARLAWISTLAVLLAACGKDAPDATAPIVAQPAANTKADIASAPQTSSAKAASGSDSDIDLAQTVKSALVADRQVNAPEIDVVAAKGTVTLYGTAPTQASRERAARVAAGIAGVKSVKNRLAVVAGS